LMSDGISILVVGESDRRQRAWLRLVAEGIQVQLQAAAFECSRASTIPYRTADAIAHYLTPCFPRRTISVTV
jgi:hypothetical protein